jgi:hypothetical protein
MKFMNTVLEKILSEELQIVTVLVSWECYIEWRYRMEKYRSIVSVGLLYRNRIISVLVIMYITNTCIAFLSHVLIWPDFIFLILLYSVASLQNLRLMCFFSWWNIYELYKFTFYKALCIINVMCVHGARFISFLLYIILYYK